MNIDTDSDASITQKIFLDDIDNDGHLDIISSNYSWNNITWYKNNGESNPSWTKTNIDTLTSSVNNLYVADMDNDGDKDIVCTIPSGTILWYENGGESNPSWTQKVILNFNNPQSFIIGLKVVDINSDGHKDIITSHIGTDNVSVYLNDGANNPSWSENLSVSISEVLSIDVADMDRDGDLDIIAAPKDSQFIYLYKNSGGNNPGWTTSEIISSGSETNIRSIHASDMDGDGDMDLISGSYGDNKIRFHKNNGSTVFITTEISTSPTSFWDISSSDIDGDGDLDIVASSYYDNAINYYENDGASDPSWTKSNIASSNDLVKDIEIGDIDGDGDMDIISAFNGDSEREITWFESNASDINIRNEAVAGNDYTSSSGTATIAAGQTSTTISVPIFADSQPENNEKAAITLSNASSGRIIDSTGKLTIGDDDSISFTKVESDNNVSLWGPTGIKVGDINSDGNLDIVSVDQNANRIAWYKNEGSGYPSWNQSEISQISNSLKDVDLADIDNDGDLDVIFCDDSSDTIAWYENDGNNHPSWTLWYVSNNGDADGVEDIHIADIDGDGDLDIVSANRNDNTIAWYKNTDSKNNGWEEEIIATNASAASGVYVADIDGDGDLDIVSTSKNDNKIAWYKNDGNSAPGWTTVDITTSAFGAEDVYVADVDGDGDLDIVSAESSMGHNTIAWYENDGAVNPTWSATNIATNAEGAKDVHVADVDGDGDLDIVSASTSDNKITFYENDGNATPSWSGVDIDTNANGPFDIEIADLDGDGDLDIISTTYNDNKIAWYRNDCNGNDPLIFDLDGDGIELLGLDADVTFDVDADGELENTGWMSPDDGLLVLDIDNSGFIENMKEVFSERFNNGGYSSSIEALASLDVNNDQIINHLDNKFKDIQLWQDFNSDGISSENELFKLNDHGIRSISLEVEAINKNALGNQIDSISNFKTEEGLTSIFAEVTFVMSGSERVFNLVDTITGDPIDNSSEFNYENKLKELINPLNVDNKNNDNSTFVPEKNLKPFISESNIIDSFFSMPSFINNEFSLMADASGLIQDEFLIKNTVDENLHGTNFN